MNNLLAGGLQKDPDWTHSPGGVTVTLTPHHLFSSRYLARILYVLDH